jgi:hypothetical protein
MDLWGGLICSTFTWLQYIALVRLPRLTLCTRRQLLHLVQFHPKPPSFVFETRKQHFRHRNTRTRHHPVNYITTQELVSNAELPHHHTNGFLVAAEDLTCFFPTLPNVGYLSPPSRAETTLRRPLACSHLINPAYTNTCSLHCCTLVERY